MTTDADADDDDPCTCGGCHECDIRGTAHPRPDAPTADDLLAASDPHARPARKSRGAKADATPGLFDAPNPEVGAPC